MAIVLIFIADPGISEGGWSEWSDWTECSRQCSGGRQQRTRTCEGGYRSSDCEGPSVMERVCNLQPCKGFWSCWTDWSPCSVTCGQGVRSRSRTCMFDGHDSAGANSIEFEGCPGQSEMMEFCNNPSCERKLPLRLVKLVPNARAMKISRANRVPGTVDYIVLECSGWADNICVVPVNDRAAYTRTGWAGV